MFWFWNDLKNIYLNIHKIQVSLSHSGTTPNQITTFEFSTNRSMFLFPFPLLYPFQFQIIFFENLPNIVKCVYFNIPDGGQSATIGVQSNFFSLMKE